MLSEVVLARLRTLLGDRRSAVRGTAVLACAPGERHELGLLALAVLLQADGWLAVYLGADTPRRRRRDGPADERRPALPERKRCRGAGGARSRAGRAGPAREARRRHRRSTIASRRCGSAPPSPSCAPPELRNGPDRRRRPGAGRRGTRPRRAAHHVGLRHRPAVEPLDRQPLRAAGRTCSTSAAIAGRSHSSSGSRRGTSVLPPRSTKSAAAEQDDLGPAHGQPVHPPASARAGRRRRQLRGIGRGEHERLRLLVASMLPQPLDCAGERELGAAEPFDEVAAPAGADRLEILQLRVDGAVAALPRGTPSRVTMPWRSSRSSASARRSGVPGKSGRSATSGPGWR